VRRALPPALAAAVLAAAALWLVRRGEPPPSQAARSADAAVARPASPVAPVPAAPAPEVEPGLPPRPRSLRATKVDGGLVVDADGRFVPTPDARRLFDYYLAATGEEPDEVIQARVRAAIGRRLQGEAARQAEEVFARYLTYREGARVLAEQGLGDAPLRDRFARIHALRRETLGDATADAFFGEEEAAEQAALDGTPQPEMAPALLALTLRAEEARIRAAGGGPAEIRALRERLVGPEAADRLEALDRARAAR
jgi:lipase chaperone LimK